MRVTVIGTGFVGLVQGAVLADAGHCVVCMDTNEEKLANLRLGILPIFEPGLEPIVRSTLADGRLVFTTDAAHAVAHAEVIFIAVGTPPNEDGSADLQHVIAVAETIGMHIDGYKVVVNKSTVPVGTAQHIESVISEVLNSRGVDLEFDVVSNPEFLKEGAAVADCQRPDRIVIGTTSKRAEKILRELYESFNRNHDRILVMDAKSSELTKYAANCMLATKISFMNEMAGIAERVGADIESVRLGIGSDSRIGYHFIYAGAGYGGSCFPKDVRALMHTARQNGFEPKILKAVELRNNSQKNVVFEKLSRHFDGKLEGRTIALWGLAFKPNTDDMRDAPSRNLMESLWGAGAKVQAFDPVAMQEAQRIYGNNKFLLLAGTKEAALNGSDALAILTEWRMFKTLDFEAVKKALVNPVIVDGRNLYDPSAMRAKGITYYGVGR
jgi:UDPglucose 6-dehydrogenase